jgi:hypothetical protein
MSKTDAQLDREVEAFIGKRPRRIVELAAKMTKVKMAKHWLKDDERGTFEKMAARLLETSAARAKEFGMTEEAVDEATAIEVLLAALKAVERHQH